MSVSFYDFKQLHNDEFRTEIKRRFSEIVEKGAFVEGEYNTLFEKQMAQMQGAKNCLLVANGTDALEISLKVYDVQPGDLVGVPGITFYATSEAVLNCGATPVWIDVDSKTGLICPESLKRVAESHTLKAVIPVHIYGLPAPMLEIERVCTQHGISIIEDAAQAHGALLESSQGLRSVGDSSNLVTFSFYPTKNLSAFGDAGAILTNDDQLVEKIKCIRNHGRGDLPILGRNSRCDHLQAAVLHLKLSYIEKWNQARKEIAKKYHQILGSFDLFELLPESFLKTSSWHLYPVFNGDVETRARLMDHLQKNGIGCTPFYEKAQSQEKFLQRFEQGEVKDSEALAGRALCLPIHPFVSDGDIEEIVTVLKKF